MKNKTFGFGIIFVLILFGLSYYLAIVIHTNCPTYGEIVYDEGRPITSESDAKQVFLSSKDKISDRFLHRQSDLNNTPYNDISSLISFKGNILKKEFEGWVPEPYGILSQSQGGNIIMDGIFIGKDGKIYSFRKCR
ncbi:MAG TPA: hypothetical protein VJH37_03045 [Candidatus Nanoarchaeia archaeon]|nr:hypothetical protein [Candidatus Nanoarchaeia archaeon]